MVIIFFTCVFQIFVYEVDNLNFEKLEKKTKNHTKHTQLQNKKTKTKCFILAVLPLQKALWCLSKKIFDECMKNKFEVVNVKIKPLILVCGMILNYIFLFFFP